MGGTSRGYTPPCIRMLHNVLWMLRTVVTHHTQYTVSPTVGATATAAITGTATAAATATATAINFTEPAKSASARARSRLAVMQLLPCGMVLIRLALCESMQALVKTSPDHMITDLLLPTSELIELLLDIVAWPVGDDSSSLDIENGPGMHIWSEDLVTWDAVAVAIRSLDACWTLALAADTATTLQGLSNVSVLLHHTTARLLVLMTHRFHDGILADNALGSFVGLFLRETSVKGGILDPATFPAIITRVMERAENQHSKGSTSTSNPIASNKAANSGGMFLMDAAIPQQVANTTQACLLEPDDARCLRGHDNLLNLIASGALPALDGLGKIVRLPVEIVRNVVCVQIRLLLWMRAALVPLCALGSGRAAWQTSFLDRLTEVQAGTFNITANPDLYPSTIHGVIKTTNPVFLRLAEVLRELSLGQGNTEKILDAFPQVPWVEAYSGMRHLTFHAEISFRCQNCIDFNPTIGESFTSAYTKMFRRLERQHRNEAACLQFTARSARVGCCYSDCMKVDARTSHREADVALQRCSQCEAVSYCSRGCQKAAWGEHKLVCKVLGYGRKAKLEQEG